MQSKFYNQLSLLVTLFVWYRDKCYSTTLFIWRLGRPIRPSARYRVE